MNISNILLAAVALILLFVAFLQGKSVCLSGLKIAGATFLRVLPLLVAAFIISGLLQVLIPKEIISGWLSDEAGFKGIMIACVAGAVTPGGPYVSLPIAFSLYKSGAGIGCLVAYIAGWKMWTLAGIPYELTFLGPRITLLLRVSLLAFPPIAGLIAQILSSNSLRNI